MATSCLLYMICIKKMVKIYITIITGVRLKTKSIKPRPVALPIMMFGGSPIKVAVPPILEAMISEIKNGNGLSSSCLAMAKVTGTINSTVVTLSKNADKIAVIKDRAAIILIGSPLELLAALIAKYSKIPVCLVIPTIIIIPTSKPMVLKSIASTICSRPNIFVKAIKLAPTKATTVR
ncbi:MAG: hypothetical protein A4E56_00280 [Pelotomaculum sp. PtaU1.Bin065]|nr:MAG: hypothetical protein A4E56_00280 [Pelotomaculum sp. PtaU1.Bin065]